MSKSFKLVDAEIAKEVLNLNSNSKSVYFMAPEVLKGEGFTARSDVWSFGMLTWQILMFGKYFRRLGISVYLFFMSVHLWVYVCINLSQAKHNIWVNKFTHLFEK